MWGFLVCFPFRVVCSFLGTMFAQWAVESLSSFLCLVWCWLEPGVPVHPETVLQTGFLKVALQILGGTVHRLFLWYLYLNPELLITPSSPANCLQLSLCMYVHKPDRGTGGAGHPSVGQTKGVWPDHMVVEWRMELGSLCSGLTSRELLFPSAEGEVGLEKWKLMPIPSAVTALGSLHLDRSKMCTLCISLLNRNWITTEKQGGRCNLYWFQDHRNSESVMGHRCNGTH